MCFSRCRRWRSTLSFRHYACIPLSPSFYDGNNLAVACHVLPLKAFPLPLALYLLYHESAVHMQFLDQLPKGNETVVSLNKKNGGSINTSNNIHLKLGFNSNNLWNIRTHPKLDIYRLNKMTLFYTQAVNLEHSVVNLPFWVKIPIIIVNLYLHYWSARRCKWWMEAAWIFKLFRRLN